MAVVNEKTWAWKVASASFTSRVNKAFEKLTAGKSFTGDQSLWLERIREHLIANLSIDKDDFEVVPIFTHFGGWGRANRAFNNQLGEIIQDLNEAIAA